VIARLRGLISEVEPEALIVEIAGVGLRVRVPSGTLASAQAGQEIALHTYLYVREAELSLYGAPDAASLRIFEALLGVGGIGPKLAMGLLSAMPADSLLSAIESESVDLLTRVPGVGRKTAQRIILDLKGKLPEGGKAPASLDGTDEDALLALVELGYSRFEAAAALASLDEDVGATSEERLRAALRHLAQP
jgi:Holliday junction DNA helicase RuvA